LQNTLTHWLITGQLKANPILPDCSIKPFIDAFRNAVREPQVQAWFASKGLDQSTVRVFSDGVEGTVLVDGEEVVRRFTTTDGSGWWEVAASVTEAVNSLSPGYFGVLLPHATTGRFRHVDVILNFYGVKSPAHPSEGPRLGQQLKQDGWPTITDEKHTQWRQQFGQLLQKNADVATRAQVTSQLQALVEGKGDNDTLDLGGEPVSVHPESTLAQTSQIPRERFAQWLAQPPFKAFIDGIGLGGEGNVYRIYDGQLELRYGANQWRSLQGLLDDEISKVQAGGGRNDHLGAAFNELVALSKTTGNTLYSASLYDIRQCLAFSGLGCPDTVAQLNAAIGWLGNQLPPSPVVGDYAGLSPYAWRPGALSPQDLTLLRTKSIGPASVTHALIRHLAANDTLNDQHLQLQAFFDSPQAIAKAQELAQLLSMVEVSGGRTLSRATRHQLLASTLKLGVTAELPGTPGSVAGYEIYQPGNLGRTLDDVRGDIEALLKRKGADATIAPLIAHMLLAQAAPEFLVNPDPALSAQAPDALKLSPGQVSIGSASWMNLRLGCALAEKLGAAGSSRLLNITQAQALARLNPMGAEHELLIKSLGTPPLLDWAVMNGVLPKAADGHYAPGDYEVAAQAFADRTERLHTAFQTFTREPPTQTSLLIEQLAQLFPEMTKDDIADFKLELDTRSSLNPIQLEYQERLAPRLTDVILAQQATLDPMLALRGVLNTYLSGEKTYLFNHPKVSQQTFDERIKRLPVIESLVAPAVDQHLAEMRSAQETVVRLMIANAPPDVRRALEVGKVELFTLREETGQPVSQDIQDNAKVAEKIARCGVLLRYETESVGYLEIFPGSMRTIRRVLPPTLALGGVMEKGPVPYGPFAYVSRDFRKASYQPFDLQAYKTGSEPRAGVSTQAILEKAGETLPGLDVSQRPTFTSADVPNTWASTKTGDIARAIVNATFDVKRATLMESANELTPLQKKLYYPFNSGKAFTPENLRTVLSLIPFVGAIADLSEGKIGAGLKGLLIDFASFAVTGGLAGAKNFFRGVKAIVPFSSRAFTLREAKGASQFFRSLFNPLDNVSGVLRIGPKAIGAARQVLSGEVVSVGSGFYLASTAFERCRWGLGVYKTLASGAETRTPEPYPGSQLGWSQHCALHAVQLNAKWYAIDPVTQKPTGAPLRDFTLDAPVS
jgi:hypothetical protein